MLIEQAFHNLPEILLGSGYAKQDYQKGFEASIVAAFSLAVLQELNGRNATNPISYLMAEKRYPDVDAKIRADLYVNLSRLFTGSESYANFGFRFCNWIEAKYFRRTGGTPPNTQNLGSIVADLFRLVVLLPKEEHERAGRYFLHIYRGDPLKQKLIKAERDDQAKTKREWVTKLLSAGDHVIDDIELAKEVPWKSFFTHLGAGFDTATCKLVITNYKLIPAHGEKEDSYTLVLTRIDSAVFKFKGKTLTITADRKVVCDPADKLEELRKEVAGTLKPKKQRKPRAKKAAKKAASAP